MAGLKDHTEFKASIILNSEIKALRLEIYTAIILGLSSCLAEYAVPLDN